MPLYKTITIEEQTKLLIWNIKEPYKELSEGIELTPHCFQRVNSMKSDLHRRGFMSVRHILKHFGYTDFDLFYDEFGKPHLRDGNHISITHSFEFAAVIVSKNLTGIDIEMQRDKIIRIAHKFVNTKELRFLPQNEKELISMLTIIWGVKESLYKLYAIKGLSFEDHIEVDPFHLNAETVTASVSYFQNKTESFKLSFTEFEGYTCVYVLP